MPSRGRGADFRPRGRRGTFYELVIINLLTEVEITLFG